MKTITAAAICWCLMTSTAWGQKPIRVSPGSPQGAAFEWDRKAAGHLMRRAGFSASPAELDRILDQGLTATLNELLNPQLVDDTGMEVALALKNYQLARANNQGMLIANPVGGLRDPGMNHWWLYRMINSRRQLVEKMTFFWHDHFATSAGEIRFVNDDGYPLMMVQHDLLRAHALGNFKEMVSGIARDPAMLIWLDNIFNVKEEPNENWARELLELFTMGVDQYTEEDIQEAARAFTGWTLARRGDYEFIFVPFLHDFGQKTFLGQAGPWDGDDIIRIIFEQEVTAEFIARKVWAHLVYPDPSEDLIRGLARVFRDSGYEIKALLSAILRHPEFFSERAYRTLIKNPVEMTVGFMREMELTDPIVLPFFLVQMNQVLFLPPDVGGWTSGVGWVNTSTLLSRYNFVNFVATYRGQENNRLPLQQLDLLGMIQEYGLLNEEDVVSHLADRLLQGDITPDEGLVFEDYLRRSDDGAIGDFDITDPLQIDKKVRGLAYLAALLPAYQLN